MDKLHAALAFQGELRRLRDEGSLDHAHEAIGRGEGGVAMAADWKVLNERSQVEKSLRDLDDLRDATAGLWNGRHTKAEDIVGAVDFHAHLTAVLASLATTVEELALVKATLQHLLGEANGLLEPGGAIATEAHALVDVAGQLSQTLTDLATTGCFTESGRTRLNDIPLADVLPLCEGILQSEPRLHAWCAWRRTCAEANSLGLTPLVRALEDGVVVPGDARSSYETNYCRWWLNAAVDNEPVIRDFVSAEHEKRIRDFRELVERFTTLTRDWLRARLCAGLPDPEGVERASEWGTLRHEINKKSRHLPLRELISRTPTALTKLTPCLLMSPLSIAQYLPPDASAFDLVVFDEASQIPVWDAIGAIARGKQVVMVGDPKQLPPTSFFDRAGVEADLDDDDEGDLESILDECIGANLPVRNLNWHYRSRHESLIAFSNQRYYESKLITFPSPVTDDQAVSLHPVPGIYGKGASRTNPVEARALVNDLVARLRSPGFRESRLTVGVVTFNAEQQRLIEDLLDEARRQDPSLEAHFDEAELEPVFVKNLESVQGDERDIMYFSITYGPDRVGLLSMNFGPLNRQGGERRLNVAITRARQELRVFASLHPEQMDLARTNAVGVRDLKQFLEFAARGPRALAEATQGSRGGFDSPFEQAVATALADRGWHLHTQIGVSQFRIDLGVVDPDAPGRYLAGIECDGATYHRSATARDRDKLREQVLRGLGWEILRIWSTDWWINPADVVAHIDSRLRDLLDVARARRTEEVERIKAAQEAREETARLAAEAVTAQAAYEAAGRETTAVVANSVVEAGVGVPAGETPRTPIDEMVYAKPVPTEPLASSPQASNVYVETDPSEAVDQVDAEQFFAESYTLTLTRMITHVVNHDGPILDGTLARRIARAHGWLRTGSRIRHRVTQVAKQAHPSSKEDVGTFFWPNNRDATKGMVFRRPMDEGGLRSVEEICLQELTALALEVQASGKRGEEALYAMARILGLQQLRAANRSRLEKVMLIDQALGTGSTPA